MTTMTPPLAADDDARLRVLYGDPALAPPARTNLAAGPLTLVYTDLGDLRYVRWGRHEIVRRLYHAVRDERWGTVPAEITVTERTVGPDSFRIAYEARHRDEGRGIDFLARVTLTGAADGTITYDFDGEALSTFSRNRIGVCVLHPAQDCKARPCRVTHPGGDVEEGAFPDLIAPHQPFFEIAAIEHGVGEENSGVTARIDFAGDVFEMEDQRNWLDASYKTYSTPLALPMPVEVPAGTRIRQTVTLSVTGAGPTPPPTENGPVVVTLARPEPGKNPSVLFVGLMLPPDGSLPDAVTAVLKTPQLAEHYRIDVDMDYQDAARQSLQSARKSLAGMGRKGASTEPDLFVGLRNARSLPRKFPGVSGVEHWFLLNPAGADMERLQEVIEDYSTVITASPSNFTELNRKRPAPETFDAVCWAANPQVHAFDLLSIMETPPMLVDALRTANSFDENTERHLGPLTFSGPYRPADLRQQGLVAAAWYTAILCYAISETDTLVTLCETHGPRGVINDQGVPYPVFHALRAVTDPLSGGFSLAHTVEDPTRIAAMGVYSSLQPDARPEYTFLVNLTPDEQAATVRGLRAENATVRVLDETNALTGFSEPRPLDTPGGEATLTLSAYAIAEVVTGQGAVD